MKRIVVLCLLVLMLVMAGTFTSSQTSASPVVKDDCPSTNPPKPDGCSPYLFLGCEKDENEVMWEIYESQICPNMLIHRPIN
jgi:hypothetical protein